MPGSLVVQTSFLGDTVLTTPLLAYLAERGAVDVVCTPGAAALLANHPAVREIIVYDKRGRDRGIGGFARLAARLRRARYDAAYHAQGSVRSGALTTAARIRDRVGFATSAGRRFYTTAIAPIENVHHAARLLALGTRDPLQPVPRHALRPRLYPGAAERAAVDTLFAEHAREHAPEKMRENKRETMRDNMREHAPEHTRENGDGAARALIALAPGSVWATKRWPYYPELARLLAASARVVVVGGGADAALAREIVDATGGRAIDATGRLSLLASAELIRRAALLLTNDSSPLHLASAMNTPTLAIFGPTVPEFGFGPLADASAVAGIHDLECRPCDRHGPRKCPLGHWRCMRDQSADTIAEAVRRLMQTSADGATGARAPAVAAVPKAAKAAKAAGAGDDPSPSGL